MPPALVGTPGTAVYVDTPVPASQTLTPGTGTGYAVGDLLVCFTSSINLSLTAQVATPSGWTKVGEAAGSSAYKHALFVKVATTTSESAPSVAWSGLTTGTAGTSCGAVVFALANVNTANLATVADVVGASSTGSSSATAANGGTAITTGLDNSLILKMSIRGRQDLTGYTASGYTNVGATAGILKTTNGNSGVGFAAQLATKVMTPAGLEAAANFTLSGAVAAGSMGWMVALKAAPAVANTVPPVVSGTRVVDQVLSCGTGTWTGSPTLTYQWQRDGVDISGQTANTYTLVTADIGHAVRCVVTGTVAPTTVSANSNTLSIVADIVAADVKFWTASGSGLGGSPSEAIPAPTAVYDSVTHTEAQLGDVEYRLIYLKNTHAVRSLTSTLV